MKNSIFKLFFFLFFLVFQVGTGQILDKKLVTIQKTELHKEVQHYVRDVKKWAKENHFDNYLITLSIKEQSSLVQEYNLYVMLDNTVFERPNAKEFALIENTPVFIIKENYSKRKADGLFTEEFQKKYAANLFDMQKYRQEELDKHYENAKKYPDSTITLTIGDREKVDLESTDGLLDLNSKLTNIKRITVNLRDFKPVIFDIEVLPKEKRPKSLLLLFDGQKLIYKKAY